MSRRTSAIIGVTSLIVLGITLIVAALVSSSGGRAAPRGWSDPQRAPVPASAVPTATAIVDPAGRVHVAFVERRRGTSSLLEVVRGPGGTWSAPQRIVSDQPFTIAIAGLAADARGDAAALWTYGGDRRQVLVASTRTATGAWSPEQALSRTTPGVAFGQIGMDAAGATTVIGRGLEGPGLWAVRGTGTGGWQPPVRISPPGLGTDAPTLTVSPDGRADVLTLLKRPGAPRALWSRRADAAGRWGAGARLPGSESASAATLTSSEDGSAVASWIRVEPSTSRRLAATRSRSGAWSAPISLDDPSHRQLAASAVLAEASGATVIWARWDARPQDRSASIRAQRLRPTAEAATASTIAALRLGPVDATPGSVVLYGPPPVELRVAPGPEPALMWNATSESRPGDPATISVSSRGADGRWSPPQPLGTPGRLTLPVAIATSPGAAVAVWMETAPPGPANAIFVAER